MAERCAERGFTLLLLKGTEQNQIPVPVRDIERGSREGPCDYTVGAFRADDFTWNWWLKVGRYETRCALDLESPNLRAAIVGNLVVSASKDQATYSIGIGASSHDHRCLTNTPCLEGGHLRRGRRYNGHLRLVGRSDSHFIAVAQNREHSHKQKHECFHRTTPFNLLTHHGQDLVDSLVWYHILVFCQ